MRVVYEIYHFKGESEISSSGYVITDESERFDQEEYGTEEEAMDALNQVHRRAYGHDPNAVSAVDFEVADYPGDAFIDLIIKERGYEFQLEGKRWVELKRTGKLVSTILEAKGKVVTEADYLWPIPVAEMSANKALDPATDQNPGY